MKPSEHSYDVNNQEFLTSFLSQLVNDKHSAADTASALFLISASYFLGYDVDADPKDVHAKDKEKKFSEYTYKLLGKEVNDAINKTKSPEEANNAIVYWLDVMTHLLNKGDYNSAGVIRLMIDGLASKKSDAKLTEAFETLPEGAKKQMSSFVADRSLKLLSTYQGKHPAIPFMELFSMVKELVKEAKFVAGDAPAGKVAAENPALTKIRDFAHNARKNTQKTAQREMSVLLDMNTFKNEIKEYSESHRVGGKKDQMSHLLLKQLESMSGSYTDQAQLLRNFIKSAPNFLQHSNPLNKLLNREFTLVTMAKDMLAKVEVLAVYETAMKTEKKQPPVDASKKEAAAFMQKWEYGQVRKDMYNSKELIGDHEQAGDQEDITPVKAEPEKAPDEMTFKEKLQKFQKLVQDYRDMTNDASEDSSSSFSKK